MNLTDLTNDYQKHILRENDLHAYQKTYPALFKHYFRYWGDKGNTFSVLTMADIKKRKKVVIDNLKIIVQRMNSAGFDLKDIDCVLFVGQGTSNGHAFIDRKKIVIWIAVEAYKTNLQCLVFITHEIIHGLHYLYSPHFYFQNAAEKRSIARLIITEGLATYLSMKILGLNMGTALWADYISTDTMNNWLQKCREKEQELYNIVLKNFSSRSPKLRLFYADDTKNIYQNRAGYFIGLRIVNQICKEKKIKFVDLIRIPRNNFEKLVIEQLRMKTKARYSRTQA